VPSDDLTEEFVGGHAVGQGNAESPGSGGASPYRDLPSHGFSPWIASEHLDESTVFL
jgi:hypothetical protein